MLTKDEMRRIIWLETRTLGGGVTFVELHRALTDSMEGKWCLCSTAHPNIIIWVGVNQDFIDALQELMTEGKIEMRSTAMLTYLVDGESLSLPLATRSYNYKKPHWLPMCVNLAPEYSHKKSPLTEAERSYREEGAA